MADNETEVKTTPRTNDWEVVTLTASTYAAAPGPEQVKLHDSDERNNVKEDEAETSKTMLMSGHFAYPPTEHEILQEPENFEISSVRNGSIIDLDMKADNGGKSEKKDEKKWNEMQIFSEKGDILSFDEVKLKEEAAFPELNLVEGELDLYRTGCTMHDEEIIGLKEETSFQRLNLIEKEMGFCRSVPSMHDKEVSGHEQVVPAEGGFDLDISRSSVPAKGDENNVPGYSCEAWWKKQAASLYAQAKEANAFWSIFVAATVMGLVILQQQWQLERWQVLHLRWWFSVNNEKTGWMLSPLSHFKDVIFGCSRRGFPTRGSSLTEN